MSPPAAELTFAAICRRRLHDLFPDKNFDHHRAQPQAQSSVQNEISYDSCASQFKINT